MTESLILELGQSALWTVIMVAGPLLGLSLVTGLLVSVFQATTQINEQTLTFIPKILAVLVGLALFGPWMMTVLVEFTLRLFDGIPQWIG